MAIDPPCPLETMLARFGETLKAARRRTLELDGIDGSNEPANPWMEWFDENSESSYMSDTELAQERGYDGDV